MKKFLLIMIMLCVGCGTIQLDTNEKKYVAARAELNLFLEQYILIQDKISDEDHAKAKAAFIAADQALDTWELFLGKDYDYSNDLMAWLETKRIILDIIRRL